MIKKCIVLIVCVLGLLQTGLFIDEKSVSKKVMSALHDAEFVNITEMIQKAFFDEDIAVFDDTTKVDLAANESTSQSKESTPKIEEDTTGKNAEKEEEIRNKPEGRAAWKIKAAERRAKKAAEKEAARIAANATTPGNLEKEWIYYDHHHQQMQELVNESTILDWNRNRRREGKYRPWLNSFDYQDLGVDPNIANSTKVFFRWDKTLCKPAKIFHEYRMKHPNASKPHVLLARVNQDFGAFSSAVKGRTGNFKKLPRDWISDGCPEDFVMDYINHPDTLAVFTNQFQKWNNPKVISLPLGLHVTLDVQKVLMNAIRTYSPAKNRTQLLMINSGSRTGRSEALAKIQRNFLVANYSGGIPKNTHNNYNKTACPFHPPWQNLQSCYYWEMSQSKFVLSPSGLGVDCYRSWEAIYTGAIPIIERLHENDGWFENTLADLPIAWVYDFKEVTPEFLEKEYDRIVHQTPPSAYKFKKMTRQYWIEMAYSILEKHNVQVSRLEGAKR